MKWHPHGLGIIVAAKKDSTGSDIKYLGMKLV
jgi:hypothetical protein